MRILWTWESLIKVWGQLGNHDHRNLPFALRLHLNGRHMGWVEVYTFEWKGYGVGGGIHFRMEGIWGGWRSTLLNGRHMGWVEVYTFEWKGYGVGGGLHF